MGNTNNTIDYSYNTYVVKKYKNIICYYIQYCIFLCFCSKTAIIGIDHKNNMWKKFNTKMITLLESINCETIKGI